MSTDSPATSFTGPALTFKDVSLKRVEEAVAAALSTLLNQEVTVKASGIAIGDVHSEATLQIVATPDMPSWWLELPDDTSKAKDAIPAAPRQGVLELLDSEERQALTEFYKASPHYGWQDDLLQRMLTGRQDELTVDFRVLQRAAKKIGLPMIRNLMLELKDGEVVEAAPF